MHRLIRQLRNARRKSGVTQEELADRAGVCRRSLGRIENYQQSPTLEFLERILPHIGMTLTLTPQNQQHQQEDNAT